MAQTLTIAGKKFRLVSESEYQRLVSRSPVEVPPMPKRLASGNYPAVEAARARIAQHIVAARQAAGLSQAELARRAGVRAETLNRIEKGRHTADTATIEKLSAALDAVTQKSTGGHRAR